MCLQLYSSHTGIKPAEVLTFIGILDDEESEEQKDE